MKNLSDITHGRDLKIIEYDVGGDKDFQHRLYEMGFFPGQTIRVLRHQKKGAYIVGINGSRYAIGYDVVKRLRVKECD